jgi:hypothetical protein
MGSLDRVVRNEIVTTRGKVLGHNYSDTTDTNLFDGIISVPAAGQSDLLNIIGYNVAYYTPAPASATNAVRVLYPHYGQFVEAYLDFVCALATNDGTTAIDNPIQVRFAIGQFTQVSSLSDVTQPILTADFNSDYVKKYHKLITGSENGIVNSGITISALRLNLTQAIEFYMANDKLTTALDNDPVISLLICFNKLPTATGSNANYVLTTFKVTFGVTGIK